VYDKNRKTAAMRETFFLPPFPALSLEILSIKNLLRADESTREGRAGRME
jgi:hypothetical protein